MSVMKPENLLKNFWKLTDVLSHFYDCTIFKLHLFYDSKPSSRCWFIACWASVSYFYDKKYTASEKEEKK